MCEFFLLNDKTIRTMIKKKELIPGPFARPLVGGVLQKAQSF